MASGLDAASGQLRAIGVLPSMLSLMSVKPA